MKKQFYLFAALFALLLVGCKKEQADLSIEALPDSAVLTGQVVYSAGIGADSSANYTADVILPATGKKVIVSVPLAKYKSGASGTRVFEAVVDAEGKFSITIPCLKEGLDGATLRLEEFSAQRSMGLLKMEAGEPVFDIRMCKFFKNEEALPHLNPGANIYPGGVIQYKYEIIDMHEYAETAVLVGQLRFPVETAYAVGSYVAAAEVDAEITIQDGEDIAESVVKKFTYGVTTDKQGNFKLEVPIKSLRKGFQINDIVVLTKGENAFKHFKQDGSSVNFAGAYKLRANETSRIHAGYVLSDIVEDIDCNLGAMAMRFIPNYNNDVADVVVPAGWDENLAGWELGSIDFADYTESITLSGSLMMAKETAFGVGEYAPAVREKVELTIGGYLASKLIVPTDANGNYSITIPLKQATDKYAVTVDLKAPEVISFVHFTAADKSRELKDGKWVMNGNPIREKDADWNLLGVAYCKFAPASSLKADTYVDDLLGWFVSDYEFVTPAITGSVKLAKETAFAKGEYVNANNLRVRVTLGANTVVVPLVDGNFNFVFPIETENQKFASVGVALVDAEELAFEHITIKKTMKLEGNYNFFVQDKEKEAEWNECGTYFFKFAPNASEPSYIDYLAGWQVVPNYKESILVSGEAFRAYEKSFAIGAYEAAKDQIAVVTVNSSEVSAAAGMQFAVPVDANGHFSVNIPIEQAGDKLDNRPDVSIAGAEVDDFVHFKDAEGATCTLKGDYKNPQTIRDPKAENTDLGQKYFAFVPNGNNKPSNTETFDDNLAGWFVVPFGWEAGEVFEGTISQPVENGFWNAGYKAFANKKIEIKASNIVSKFVVLTDKDGNYSYQSYRSSDKVKVTVSLSLSKTKHIEEKAFVHYYNLDNPKSKEIEGTYAISFPTDWTARGNKMGITYLAFKPTTTPDDWRDDYYGWMKVKCMEPSDVKKNVTFKLYAQKAMETAEVPHEAAWTDAGKQMVLVNARNNKDGKYYSLAILSSGKNISFSLPWADEPEAGVSTASAAVSFICSSENNVSFIHYPKTDDAASEKILGHWSNAYNLSTSMTFDNDAFECKNAAKLLFVPETKPEGWDLYNWNAIVNKEIE